MLHTIRSICVARTARHFAALALGLVVVAPASGQERRSEVIATYNGLDASSAGQPAVAANAVQLGNPARNTFRYKYTERNKWLERTGHAVPMAAAAAAGGNGGAPAVGMLNWQVPQSEFGTAGLDRSFRTFCAEAPVGVTPGSTYRFEIQSPAIPEAFGLPNTEAGKAEAFRRATYVRELFGRYYIPALTDVKASKAFQMALWEIIHETPWPEGQPAPLDLTAGAFSADPEQDDPASVALAKDYLKSLTGNDNVFYENPDLAGRELVRMTGLVTAPAEAGALAAAAGAAGVGAPAVSAVAAQSQFALRFTRGGATAPGAAAGVPLGGSGFGGGGGIGAGGGGFGGPGGYGGVPLAGIGAGGGSGGGSSSPGTTSTTTPPGTTPPSTTTTPPTTTTTTPPNTPPTIPRTPVNGPPTDTPNTPVPAPAGLVLGLIAAGAFVSRKAFLRATANK